MAKKGEKSGISQIIEPVDVETMAAAGWTPAQIMSHYGMTRPNFYHLMKANPELKRAFSDGLNQVILKAVKCLSDGIAAGNILAAMFFLKCRAGWLEQQYVKDKPETQIPQAVVYLPQNGR